MKTGSADRAVRQGLPGFEFSEEAVGFKSTSVSFAVVQLEGPLPHGKIIVASGGAGKLPVEVNPGSGSAR